MACVGQAKVDGATATPHQSHYSSDKYAQLILAQMNRMRILKDFCDVQLLVGGRQFSVHRLVLAASSPYFSALFTGGMREADKDIVQILGVEADVFEMLLEFIYSGVVNVTVENVQELIITADMLQLSEVVKICCEFLKVQMDPSNCVGIYQFLEQIACLDMMEFTENYIHVHFLEVCAGEEFLGLAKAQLVKILRSEELRIEDEYQVFIAAMNWVLKDVPRRKKHVVEVLDPVRFPLLSPQRLFKYIEGEASYHRPRGRAPEVSHTQYSSSSITSRYSKIRPRRKARKYLYAIGGYTRLQGGRWSDSRALSCVERFDSFSQYWTTVSSLHQARSGLGVAVLEGMIYVIGGEKDSMIFDCAERYDPVTKQWAAVASLNFPRCGVAVCSCHGALYALGGWIGSEIGKTMERYDPTDNKWEIVGSMAVPRYYFGCCELQGEKDSMIFDCAERYDPVTKQWAAVASLNFPRCGVAVCSCHGALYALGGWIGSEIGKTMERYDPTDNKWEIVGSMAVPRYYFGCCELQGFIYVIGGISDEGIELRSAEVYDPVSKRWSALPVMSKRRAYVGVASLNDCIYAVGGWNEALGSLETVEKYSPEEEKWVEVAPMGVARAGVSVTAVNGLLYAVGGRASSRDFSAPVTVDSVEIYDPHLDTWTEIGNMITSRCDGGVAVL
ncbi:UNVERIFIED_CONTAM: hypothetical protein FKN15_050779 [Acipenser sinensis]